MIEEPKAKICSGLLNITNLFLTQKWQQFVNYFFKERTRCSGLLFQRRNSHGLSWSLQVSPGLSWSLLLSTHFPVSTTVSQKVSWHAVAFDSLIDSYQIREYMDIVLKSMDIVLEYIHRVLKFMDKVLVNRVHGQSIRIHG